MKLYYNFNLLIVKEHDFVNFNKRKSIYNVIDIFVTVYLIVKMKDNICSRLGEY